MGVGRGKLLLFGEHAAVYGHAAMGIATADSTCVEVTPRNGDYPENRNDLPVRVLDYEDIALRLSLCGVPPEYADIFVQAVKESLSAASISVPFLTDHYPLGLQVSVQSNIPIGTGFGSSAALCAALASEFSDASATTFDQVWAIANTIEALFHGTPSGIDTGLSLSTGLQAIYPAASSFPAIRPVPAYPFAIMFGGVPRTGNTKELVAGVRAGIQSGDARTRNAITELGSIAQQAIRACTETSPAQQLGRLCDEAQEKLRNLNLSTNLLESRIAHAREYGACGGKLSGAGGGGAWFAVFDSVERVREARRGMYRELPPSEQSMLRAVEVSGTAVRAVE